MKRVSGRETSRCWYERWTLEKNDIQMVLLGYWNAYCKCESVNCKKLYDTISCNISSQETLNRVDSWRPFLTFQVNMTTQQKQHDEWGKTYWFIFFSFIVWNLYVPEKAHSCISFSPRKNADISWGRKKQKTLEKTNPKKPFRDQKKKLRQKKLRHVDASCGGGLLWLGTSLLFMNASSRLRADGLKGTMVAGNLGDRNQKNRLVDLKGDFFGKLEEGWWLTLKSYYPP